MKITTTKNTMSEQQSSEQQKHASTYVAGEDRNRLKSAAKYFGIQNTRTPLRPIREATINDHESSTFLDEAAAERGVITGSNQRYRSTRHSKSILKFGSTVWNNVGLLFSDSTLEAARMHSVGVTTEEEHVTSDGTLRLMSISRRKKGEEKPSYKDLMDIFHPKPLEPLEEIKVQVRPTEDEDYEEIVVESVEGGSIVAAIFGIVKGTVGPAVLYLPRGFAESGYAVAICSMILATVSYLYSATRLLQCWKVESEKNRNLAKNLEELRLLLDPTARDTEQGVQANKSRTEAYGSMERIEDGNTSKSKSISLESHPGMLLTYPELARRAFGEYSFLISGGIAAMQFGVCLTYLIFVPQNLYECARALTGVEVPKQIFLVMMLALEIPLCWIRDIRKLAPINILATAFIAFGLLAVLFIALFDSAGTNESADFDVYNVMNGTETPEVVGIEEDLSELVREVTQLPPIVPTWFLFIGTSFFCFEGSITLLVPLQEAVYKREDKARFPSVNRTVVCSIVCFYLFFATVCWASFGDNVQTALTASLPSGALSTIIQLAYSIAVIFTFPLQAFPAMEVVCRTSGQKAGTSKSTSGANTMFKRNVTASLIICFLGIIAVMAIDYLGNVVSLLGSLVGIPIALIYPPLMHNYLVTDSSKLTRFMNHCLSLVGLFAAGAASYTTMTSWDKGAEGG